MAETTPIEAVQINNGEEVRKDVVVPELATVDKTTKISAHREYSLFTELRKTKSTGEPRSVVYAKDDLYLHTKKTMLLKWKEGRTLLSLERNLQET